MNVLEGIRTMSGEGEPSKKENITIIIKFQAANRCRPCQETLKCLIILKHYYALLPEPSLFNYKTRIPLEFRISMSRGNLI